MDLSKIRKVLLSSDLPEEFTGLVKEIKETPSKFGGNNLSFTIIVKKPKTAKIKNETINIEGQETVIAIRIPKALTGKGQADLLLDIMKTKLGITNTDALKGKVFLFRRMNLPEKLPASYTEHPRHYPVEQLGQTEI